MTALVAEEARSQTASTGLKFAWLEITDKCNEECTICYLNAGPRGNHGSMSDDDWRRVIRDVKVLGADMVQFIGGEATLHPSLSSLIRYALSCELKVEVYTNLMFVEPEVWEVFSLPGVRVATSYHSSIATEHDAITKRRGSHGRTRDNIIEALRRDIRLRVGIVDSGNGQDCAGARRDLMSLGVFEKSIRMDHLRQVGRGERSLCATTDELCGHCVKSVVAITRTGNVLPCVFSRWLTVGNVQDTSLAEIWHGNKFFQTREMLEAKFARRRLRLTACAPDNGQTGDNGTDIDDEESVD